MSTPKPESPAASQEQKADGYLFGHSDGETQRLLVQAHMFNHSTRHLLADAGLGVGMKVLDVGSGAGDVAMLAAERVGPSGLVLGIDANPAILETARARVRAAGLTHVTFLDANVEEIALDTEFDAVVGRCVLFFLQDPTATLRKLVRHVRPGGIVAFQEPGNAILRPSAVPPSRMLEQLWEWIMELYRRTGMDLHFGVRLHDIFLGAGLPAPQMHLDAVVGGGPDWPGYSYMASLLRTLLPTMVKFGVVTGGEVDIDTFAERLRAEVVGQRAIVTTWSFVRAWARRGERA